MDMHMSSLLGMRTKAQLFSSNVQWFKRQVVEVVEAGRSAARNNQYDDRKCVGT